MKTTALLVCFLLSACASHKTIYTPDGRQAHSIKCDGAALSWDLCYDKAGQICKAKGYEILSQNGEERPLLTATQYGAISGSSVKRSLIIACK